MRTVPAFPLLGEPDQWDALTLLAATVFLEAEGESDDGKVAVAWVAANRASAANQSLQAVLMAPAQFSCWNADYRPMAEARLAGGGAVEEACWRAAAAAMWRLTADPTQGATFYLNPELTKKIRKKHDLPPWYDAAKVTARIGRHEFLRLG